MDLIPLEATDNQEFAIVLNGQDCRLAVYERNGRVFVDLMVSGAWIRRGMLALPLNIMPRGTAAFSGALMFVGTNTSGDPRAAGFGTEWELYYLTPEEVTELQEGQEAWLEGGGLSFCS